MIYNTSIILETKRLIFRQHTVADLEAYCAMEADPGFRRYIGGRPRTREEAERKFMEGAIKHAVNLLSMWATILKPARQYIGRCGIYPRFKPDGGVFEGEAALGLYIATEYSGRGFATEAGHAFVKLGFDELKLKRIVTAIDTRNNVSVHVIEKFGFELESTEIGELRSFYHFALRNPDIK